MWASDLMIVWYSLLMKFIENSKFVNDKKDIRFLECLSTSAEEETWILTGHPKYCKKRAFRTSSASKYTPGNLHLISKLQIYIYQDVFVPRTFFISCCPNILPNSLSNYMYLIFNKSFIYRKYFIRK